MDTQKCRQRHNTTVLQTRVWGTNVFWLLQLGLLTYISALTTIELALTHAAVYKVSLFSLPTALAEAANSCISMHAGCLDSMLADFGGHAWHCSAAASTAEGQG